MGEIEVNEYVRTKDGIIDKVENYSIGCCVWHCKNGMCIDKCNCIGTHLEDIVKHNKQLEDLIEINDIVNGYRILGIYEAIESNDERILDIGYGMAIFNDQIKTILTKEQFLANCYKVGGK